VEEKTGDQSHAKQIAYAPGVAMQRQIEENREAVPVAAGAGL
jgi:hypothetical protein